MWQEDRQALGEGEEGARGRAGEEGAKGRAEEEGGEGQSSGGGSGGRHQSSRPLSKGPRDDSASEEKR